LLTSGGGWLSIPSGFSPGSPRKSGSLPSTSPWHLRLCPNFPVRICLDSFLRPLQFLSLQQGLLHFPEAWGSRSNRATLLAPDNFYSFSLLTRPLTAHRRSLLFYSKRETRHSFLRQALPPGVLRFCFFRAHSFSNLPSSVESHPQLLFVSKGIFRPHRSNTAWWSFLSPLKLLPPSISLFIH